MKKILPSLIFITTVFSCTKTYAQITFDDFSSRVNYTTLKYPTDVRTAGLNADGKPDMIVANEGGLLLSVFKNTTVTERIGVTSFAVGQDFKAQSPISPNCDCLTKLESYADWVNLVDTGSFYKVRSYEDKIELNKCNFKKIRNNVRYERSILLVVLKLDHYSKLYAYDNSFDLIPYNLGSPGIRKVIREYFHLMFGKEYIGFPYQEVQTINGHYAVDYIQQHKMLRKDKELAKWIKLLK